MWKSVSISLFALCLVSCATVEDKKPPEGPMELTVDYKGPLGDGMDIDSLVLAANRSIEFYEKVNPSTRFTFGDRSLTPAEMALSLKRFVAIFTREDDPVRREKLLRQEFDIYRGTSSYENGNTLVTGYYQPILKGSRMRDNVYRWPIYKKPPDLVTVDIGKFHKDLAGRRLVGRVENGGMRRYHTRKKIDGGRVLAGKGLEIAWVDDPVDLFFLHVQGSGVVQFENGEQILVNYAAQNGHKYRSIGKKLIDDGAVTREAMSLDAIREYLKAHPEKMRTTFDHNPSYVFFREMDNGPFGSIGTILVPGRSAAFDQSKFPKGALAHIRVDTPIVAKGKVAGWKKTQRFLFNHDTGGAINGAGRVDLFFGLGGDAGAGAGRMKHAGEILFLVLKEKAIASFP